MRAITLFALAICLVASTTAVAAPIYGTGGVTLWNVNVSVTPFTIGSDTNWWQWTYAVTPGTTNQLSTFTLSGAAPGTFGLGAGLDYGSGTTNLSAQTPRTSASPPGVYGFWTTGLADTSISWVDGNVTFSASNPAKFSFVVRSNVLQDGLASVARTGGPSGSGAVCVPGEPVVPEPMSIFLGIMGLGSVAGFRRLRKS